MFISETLKLITQTFFWTWTVKSFNLTIWLRKLWSSQEVKKRKKKKAFSMVEIGSLLKFCYIERPLVNKNKVCSNELNSEFKIRYRKSTKMRLFWESLNSFLDLRPSTTIADLSIITLENVCKSHVFLPQLYLQWKTVYCDHCWTHHFWSH